MSFSQNAKQQDRSPPLYLPRLQLGKPPNILKRRGADPGCRLSQKRGLRPFTGIFKGGDFGSIKRLHVKLLGSSREKLRQQVRRRLHALIQCRDNPRFFLGS